MRENNKDFTISGFATEFETTSGLASFVTEIIEDIKSLIARIQQEQAEAKHHLNRKRKVQKQIHQITIGQMTVEQKLKMGIYRF